MSGDISIVLCRALGGLAFLLISQTALAAVSPPALGAGWYIADGVAAHPPLRSFGPKRSDVVFSTRFKREDVVATAKSFGATRVEWVYASEKDSEYLQLLKNASEWVGGTLNANVKTPNDEGVAQDFDGNQLIAPWMKTSGAKWVMTTNPLTRKALLDWASIYVKAGADSIQFDDPLLQLHSADWGAGDFSPTSLSGFREFLQRYPDKKKLASLWAIKLANTLSCGFILVASVRQGFLCLATSVAVPCRGGYRSSTPIWLLLSPSQLDIPCLD